MIYECMLEPKQKNGYLKRFPMFADGETEIEARELMLDYLTWHKMKCEIIDIHKIK